MKLKSIVVLTLSILVVQGCAQMRGASSSSTGAGASSSSRSEVPAGMNANGEVIDASKVEGGSGTKVTGLHDTEGEITGKFVPNSKFASLKIGMGMKQVTDLTGQPTDQGSYITGKAFIPFYFGGDTFRYELVYKGQGRLIFAGGGMGNLAGGTLIWIINSASESGYR